MNKYKNLKKKIILLHLVHGLPMGGAEMALFHYIKALGQESYKHYVYCFGTDGPVRIKIESLGVPVYMGKKRASVKQPLKFGISLIILLQNLIKFIKSNHIDIIQSHSVHANQLGVAVGKLLKMPVFPTVHSTMAFVDSRKNSDLRLYLRKIVDHITYRIAQQILAVSEEVKDVILRTYKIRNDRVAVLKNGIVFDETLSNQSDLREIFENSKDRLKVLAVGRLVAIKGFDILIKAVAEIANLDSNNLLVLIIGNGEERLRLQELIHNLNLENHVILLGLRHDVIDFMKRSDIFVIPSHYEGLSIAMIEAMACGLPIIASDSPGLKNHVRNMNNGLLFKKNNHKALARCILKLADDKNLRIKLSKCARKSFIREYDMRKNIVSLDSLLKHVYFKANYFT
jgi:glycosyltransferase involved in cell wall biosynthesis